MLALVRRLRRLVRRLVRHAERRVWVATFPVAAQTVVRWLNDAAIEAASLTAREAARKSGRPVRVIAVEFKYEKESREIRGELVRLWAVRPDGLPIMDAGYIFGEE